MKKSLFMVLFLILILAFASCAEATTTVDPTIAEERAAYQKLVAAETLSGMGAWNGILIDSAGPLGLPTAYQGVQITYASRQPDIISDDGVVTLPDTCWIQSKDQLGEEDFANLNDNWPVVLDVTMTYLGQTRTAKLMFIIAPAAGFTCDKYLGD